MGIFFKSAILHTLKISVAYPELSFLAKSMSAEKWFQSLALGLNISCTFPEIPFVSDFCWIFILSDERKVILLLRHYLHTLFACILPFACRGFLRMSHGVTNYMQNRNIKGLCTRPLKWGFNSLAPGRFQRNFRKVIFQLILVIDGWSISCKIVLKWMSMDLTDGKSTLVQVMAWCRQATRHYLSQCWPRSLSPYGVIRPQWVNPLRPNDTLW